MKGNETTENVLLMMTYKQLHEMNKSLKDIIRIFRQIAKDMN